MSISRMTAIFLAVLIAGCDSTTAPQTSAQETAILGGWSRTYLNATVDLYLGHEGQFEITIEGLGQVRGSWEIDDRNLFSVDDFACNVIGIYEYDIEAGTLEFSAVEDACTRAVFFDGEWIRSGPE